MRLPISGVDALVMDRLQNPRWASVAGCPSKHETPVGLQVSGCPPLAGLNSTAFVPLNAQCASVGTLAMISGAAAAKMSNMRDAPDVVIEMFSRMRFAKFAPPMAL